MRPLLCVMGPTASGKTGLAVALAGALDGELVGCDASQVYVGLDVGTAKATAAELGGVRHHLIDCVRPDEPFDAGIYARRADAAIADIRGRGRLPIVCGGTGLYLRALLDGLCEAPPVDAAVRARLQAELAAGHLPALRARLARVDPQAAARIAPRDAQRVERALGVFESTGRALSDWQADRPAPGARHPARLVGLRWPRAVLRERIARRVRAMFAAGFVEEVRALRAAGYGPELRSLRALGYGFISAALGGEMSLTEARERTIIATRRYAKRQETWFAKVPGVVWFDGPVSVDAVLSWWGRGDAGPEG